MLQMLLTLRDNKRIFYRSTIATTFGKPFFFHKPNSSTKFKYQIQVINATLEERQART